MFIGNQEIEKISKTGLVTFKDGTQEKFTKRMLEVVQTEQPLGKPILNVEGNETGEYQVCLTELRELRCKKVAEEITDIFCSNKWNDEVSRTSTAKLIIEKFLEWGVYVDESGYILNPIGSNFDNLNLYVINTLNMHVSKATEKLFGTPNHKRSMCQVDEILTKN